MVRRIDPEVCVLFAEWRKAETEPISLVLNPPDDQPVSWLWLLALQEAFAAGYAANGRNGYE